MSQADFETYLRLVSKLVRGSRDERSEIERELRAHLEDARDARGDDEPDVDQLARRELLDLGDPAELARQFNRLTRHRRWIMNGVLTAACFVMGAVGLGTLSGPRIGSSAKTSPAQAAAVPGQGQTRQEAHAAPRSAGDALAGHVADVSFDETHLSDVLAFLREAMQINMHVRWSTLESLGVSRDAPVNMQLRDVSFETVLKLVLSDLGPSGAVYEIQDDILVIGSRESFRQSLVTSTYQIADLLEMDGNAADAAGKSDPVGSGGQQSRIARLIMDAVEPDTWSALGGGPGWAETYGPVLVVRQYADVQEQVQRLLSDLRQKAPKLGD